MRFHSVNDWLDWQQTLSPLAIELGLERVSRVSRAMALGRPAARVITVAGTNGKGSSVAMLESILLAAGYRVGAYTSPHLLRYNERIRINGQMVSDEALCRAFDEVDRMRGDDCLTYFEFGTLAALRLFQERPLDVAILEVGLGGRLDAVNIVDADVALVTGIALDHVEWLGHDRETIGREKAGIFRRGAPAVCSDPHPPVSLSIEACRSGARLYCLGRDFEYRQNPQGHWSWQHKQRIWRDLPAPSLHGDFQYANAAGVVMALEQAGLPYEQTALVQGLGRVSLPGRFQQIEDEGHVVILDVAHNVQAATALAQMIGRQHIAGRVRAVFAMLRDKDADGTIAAMTNCVDDWYVAGLDHARACPARELAQRVRLVAEPCLICDRVQDAYEAARRDADPGQDCILVFGSFYTVVDVLIRVPAREVGADV